MQYIGILIFKHAVGYRLIIHNLFKLYTSDGGIYASMFICHNCYCSIV